MKIDRFEFRKLKFKNELNVYAHNAKSTRKTNCILFGSIKYNGNLNEFTYTAKSKYYCHSAIFLEEIIKKIKDMNKKLIK